MMTPNTRKTWLETYHRLTEEAEYQRNSQMVAFGLLDAYDQLTPAEKKDVHQILAEWFVSDDNKHRYDAAFLTGERKIVEMIPAVEKAIEWIGEPSGPEAEYELKDLKKLLSELT